MAEHRGIRAPLSLQCEFRFLSVCVVSAGSAEDRRARRCSRGQRCRGARAVGQLGPLVRLLAELQRGGDGADAALPPRLLPGARLPPAGPPLPGLRAGPAPPERPLRGAAGRLPRARHLSHPHLGAAAQERGAAVGRAEQQPGRAGGAAGQPALAGPAAQRQAGQEVRAWLPADTGTLQLPAHFGLLLASALTSAMLTAFWQGCPPSTTYMMSKGRCNYSAVVLSRFSLPFKICVVIY